MLTPGKVYFCWTGVLFGPGHSLVRADKVYFNWLAHRDGKWQYSRVQPLLRPGGREEGHPEPYLLYTSRMTCRIREGSRRGRVVFPHELDEHESYSENRVGFVMGQTEGELQRDPFIQDILARIDEAEEGALADSLPVFYTTKKGGAMPRCRRTGIH